MNTGYVHVYTGNGKGKTTAALGLAMRAAGDGHRVFIAQFVKGMHYSELDSFSRLADCITLRQFGRRCFIYKDPEPEDYAAARQGIDEVRTAVMSGAYHLVILDEANIATHYNLITVDELIELIDNRPKHVELVITGRCAHPKIIDKADLVTEMVEVKHYYNQGVMARKGIES